MPRRLTLWSMGLLFAVATVSCSGDGSSSSTAPDASDSSVDSPTARRTDSGTDSSSTGDGSPEAATRNDATSRGDSGSDSGAGDRGDVDSSSPAAESIPEAAAGNDTTVTADRGSDSLPGDGSNVDSALTDDASHQDHASGSADADSVDAGDAGPSPGVDGGFEYDPFPCGQPASGDEGRTTLLDVGHSSLISLIHQEGTLVVTRDTDDHWVLWQTLDRSRILQGDSPRTTNARNETRIGYLDLRGQTLAVESPLGTIALRNAANGALLGTVATSDPSIGLAQDGSYLWAASSTQLRAWSTAGDLLFSRDGNYVAPTTPAVIFAAPRELRIAVGPAGANVIETVTTAGAASTSAAFSGTFLSWFQDGQSFFSHTGNTVWVYPARAGTTKGIFALPTTATLTGQGDFFWTYQFGSLDIYSVATGPTPLKTILTSNVRVVVGAADVIGVLSYGEPHLDIVSLSSADLAVVSYTLPTPAPLLFSATSSGKWSVACESGVVYDSFNIVATPPRPLSCGRISSIAGATDGTVAIATAGRGIITAKVAAGSHEVVGRIPFISSRVALSDSGATLVGMATTEYAQYSPDRSLKIFSLPTGVATKVWPYDLSTYYYQGGYTLQDFGLSAGGSRLAQVTGTFSGAWSYKGTITSLDGTVTDFAEDISASSSPTLSPDGTLAALPDGQPSSTSTTRIYRNGSLISAVSGFAVGWIDNNRLLVNLYVATRGAVMTYSGAKLYNAIGAELATVALPPMSRFTPVGTNHIYSPNYNAIYDLTTGAKVWESSAPGSTEGSVAAGLIVSRDRYRVLVESGP